MHPLIFATHNENKVQEIRSLLGTAFDLISLREAGILEEIPESHDTLEANALEKSRTIYAQTGKDCFSEDTGLEVRALGGEPGVYSARYAGPGKDPAANIRLLLEKLQGKTVREARFRTVISLILGEKEYLFEGTCPGRILQEVRGQKGFGYDPVFVPDGADRCFAEMSLEEKNRYSHRAKAFHKLLDFLKQTADGPNSL